MMRSKTSTSMQKTYDDCYLICSTACYFESQNNENEALRSWRDALDQIYYQNAYKLPSGWKPRTETERALHESLRQMEKQCKERVDLLEALRDSRREAAEKSATSPANTDAVNPTPTSSSRSITSPRIPSSTTSTSSAAASGIGWLGDGTIKPVDYKSISRLPPSLPTPKPAPEKPSLFSWQRSKSSADTSISASAPAVDAGTSSATLAAPSLSAYTANSKDGQRTPSPEKKTGMLRTLRTAPKEKTSTAKMLSSLRSKPPAAAKAATQAWTSSTASPRPSIGSIDAVNASANSLSLTRTESRSKPEQYYSSPPLSRTASEAAMQNASRHGSDSGPTRGYDDASAPPLHRLAPQRSFAGGDDAHHLSVSGAANAAKAERTHTSQPASPVVPNGSWQRSPLPSSGLPPSIPKSDMPAYRKEYPAQSGSSVKSTSGSGHRRNKSASSLAPPSANPDGRSPSSKSPLRSQKSPMKGPSKVAPPVPRRKAVGADRRHADISQITSGEESSGLETGASRRARRTRAAAQSTGPSSPDSFDTDSMSEGATGSAWKQRCADILLNLPSGVDETSARQILNEIVIQGDEVHWDDVAGLDIAKSALKETVVYPFLRPDLFMGLREPARGMLLFGPPGTGKTMLARAVATESRSTFFAISASSLTSKFLGESEKLVRALFALAKVLAPSIIFVDEIDSLLSSRGGGSEHEATRRIKTEFLIQWSDLARAAAGRESNEKDRVQGDATRVLVLAATNLPWAIDEAARRRFVRRQYIPLPEDHVRKKQFSTLLGHQKQAITEEELDRLVELTEGYSGSDITALAKDAAMGPLRSLGENLLHMSPDEIRAILFEDFESSLINIRPSVGTEGLKEYEEWAKSFGERGG